MSYMLSGASQFNQDISTWDVSGVTTMRSMFQGASSFDIDISTWNISSVTDMVFMLNGATSFNQDLCAWGDKFPYDNAAGIFGGSNCTFEGIAPRESDKAPFCASSCTDFVSLVLQYIFRALLLLISSSLGSISNANIPSTASQTRVVLMDSKLL